MFNLPNVITELDESNTTCNCKDAGILTEWVYGNACKALVERNRDCVIIDAGCGSDLKLFQIKRHLNRHGITAHTIGIDPWKYDIIVDEFHKDKIQNVKLPNIADAVVARAVLSMNPQEFENIVNKIASFLKPTGLVFIGMPSKSNWNPGTKVLSKFDAIDHAKYCDSKTMLEECNHGYAIDNC